MAVQKRRQGRSRIRNRRAQWLRKRGRGPAVQACASCGEPQIPHRVCMKCGQYAGQKVIEIAQQAEE